MTTQASREGRQQDVISCIAHLKAFAAVLTNDLDRSDDLVCETIARTFTAANGPRVETNLKVLMFATLHKLHFGSPRRFVEGAGREPTRLSRNRDGVESDELLLAFYRLRDDQREALILEIASGLSYEEAAEVCDCQIDTFRRRLLDARGAISRMHERSLVQKLSFGIPNNIGTYMPSADATFVG